MQICLPNLSCFSFPHVRTEMPIKWHDNGPYSNTRFLKARYQYNVIYSQKQNDKRFSYLWEVKRLNFGQLDRDVAQSFPVLFELRGFVTCQIVDIRNEFDVTLCIQLS